jgi:GntR family transcriptional regulator / MocR family aminotransferase
MDVHISLVGRKDLSGEIYRQLRRAILDGRIRVGSALPPSRVLAERLSVARTTVTVAYDRLISEGFVESRIGAGTFVSPQAIRPARTGVRPERPGVLRPQPVWQQFGLSTAFANRARIDFRTGLPEASLFPTQRWRRLMARATAAEEVAAGVYGHPAGHRGLREAIARHIALSRGVQTSADDITITSGTQQALDIVIRVLLRPGDQVAVEDPGYTPPRLLLRAQGMRVIGVPVDREGLVVDAIPRSARMVYVTPSHQYPLGVPLSLSRRLALLRWAERHNAAVVEDDYDSEFRFGGRPIEPMQTLDPAGRVIYLGSFSKTLLPTLRLGFVVAPLSIRDAVHKAKYVTDWHTSLLAQETLAQFIEEGGFAAHLRHARAVYVERHATMAAGLDRELGEHLELVPSDAGLHVAARARAATPEQVVEVVERASQEGVEVHPLSRFAVMRPLSGLLFGYGAVEAERIPEGLGVLRRWFERCR